MNSTRKTRYPGFATRYGSGLDGRWDAGVPKRGVDRVSNDETCIYCPQTNPSRFRGVEHVIPRGFGRFGSETPTLDCVCDDCNAYFGRELDQLLTRETYQGVSRYSRGQLSREARPQRRVSLTLADARKPEISLASGSQSMEQPDC